MKENTCCFFGHRKIEDSEELRAKLCGIIENLIVKENIDTFLFGSKSDFDALCLKTVTKVKEKHPHIKRIYVRAEYPYIDDSYKAYLLENYDDTYYPEHMTEAGKAAYVERNCEMIDKSRVCVVYYSPDYAPPRRKSSRNSLVAVKQPKSGTKIAYDYAVKKGNTIINVKPD